MKENLFKVTKYINENFYNKMINNISNDIYQNKKNINDVFKDLLYKDDLYINIKNKIIELGYEDLLNGNYENLIKFNNLEYDLYLSICKKLIDDNKYEIIYNILIDNVDIGTFNNKLKEEIFPIYKDKFENRYKFGDIINNTIENQNVIYNILKLNLNNNKIKELYIKHLFKSFNDYVKYHSNLEEDILLKDLKFLFEKNYNNNIICDKNELKNFIKDNFYTYKIFNSNILMLSMFNYLNIDSFEEYTMIKNYPFKDNDNTLDNYYLEERFNGFNDIKQDIKFLILDNDFKVDVSNFSNKTIDGIIYNLKNINEIKDKNLKINLLNKLNQQLNSNIQINDLTNEIEFYKKIELKEVTKEEFEMFTKEINNKNFDNLELKINEI